MRNGEEYELFVKSIYEKIIKSDKIDNIKVEHNIILKGTTNLEHQVDLFWEFKNLGILHKVIIECKDYNSKVTKEKLMAFHDKIIDIGGVQGVYVTKTGYQTGAIEIAKKYGITILEIRKPNEKDWEGRIKVIKSTIQMFVPHIEKFKIVIDKKWIQEQGINEKDIVKGIYVSSKESYVVNENDKSKHSLMDIFNNLDYSKEKKSFIQKYNNAYYINESASIKYKIIEISFEYYNNVFENSFEVNGDKIIEAIIKDTLTGEYRAVPYISF